MQKMLIGRYPSISCPSPIHRDKSMCPSKDPAENLDSELSYYAVESSDCGGKLGSRAWRRQF